MEDNECVAAEPVSKLHRQILDYCGRVVGSAPIIAVTLFDYCATKAKRKRGTMEAVLVVRNFRQRIMSFIKVFDGKTIVVIAVDRWVFERDVERGFLGEASVGTLVFPYVALSGRSYLREQEVRLKKRLVLELLENLALDFPELSGQMRIQPEYFMYEVLLNRVRVFPPLGQCVSDFMLETELREGRNPTLDGYVDALRELERERKVRIAAGCIMVPEKFVPNNDRPKVRLTNVLKSIPRTFFTPIFEIFPQLLNLFSQRIEAFSKFQTLGQWGKDLGMKQAFIDPQRYISVPTAEGFVSLADKGDIDDFVRSKLLKGKDGRVRLKAVGGVLNDVYLIEVDAPNLQKKVLLKRFKDWSGFKWFPLSLWSLGARTFAVLGRLRLERECAISELLRTYGFNVPKVLHISQQKRLVFMEYVQGENLTSSIKRIAGAKSRIDSSQDLENVIRVGATFAKVHSFDVALGDTKPENIIVSPNGELYLLDFEQASRGGDKSWDIAEFLYYSGHYLPPLHNIEKAESLAKAFIRGYIDAGGKVSAINKAASVKYTRVFSLFTALSVLTAISTVCKKAKTIK